MLGPIEVCEGHRRVDLGAAMPRAVLALLAMSANRVVPLDRLIDELWAGDPPATATKALQGYVSTLRRALEPHRAPGVPFSVLVTEAPGYVLRVRPDNVDALRFEALVRRGRQELAGGRPAQAREALRRGLGLWRGEPYADVAYQAFASAEIGRLTELRALAQEAHAEAELAVGDHVAAVPELERLARAEPLRERRWELLALALYRGGRQGEALRALARARLVLRDELGVEPGPALRRMEDAVLDHSPTLEWMSPFAGSAASPHNLEPSPPPAPGKDVRAPDRLVGRHRELAQLTWVLAQAQANRDRRQCVLVSGEPGIGKTRLVEELAQHAVSQGSGLVAWGRCVEAEGSPYWPWAQVLATLLGQARRDELAAALDGIAGDVARLVPAVKELSGGVQPPPALHAAAARARLHRAITRFLTRLAAAQPLVVVVDDLHWADASSVELFKQVGTEVPGILLVATSRDVEGGAERLSDVLAALVGSDLVHLRLTGLEAHEVAQLVAQVSGSQPTPAAGVAMRDRTEGNPFFVVELALALGREGRAVEDLDVPPRVQRVVRERLARLPPGTTRLLDAAAVVGREFDLAVVVSAAGIEVDTARELVEIALAAGVVARDGGIPARYRFSHALVQETIRARLSAPRRAHLHARVGDAKASLRD